MEEYLKEYKTFCRNISLKNFYSHWEIEETKCKVNEKSKSIDSYDYRCTIKIDGESSKMVLRSFFSKEMLWSIGKKSLSWEKDLTSEMCLSLFEEFNNIMGASFKRSLEEVDCLELKVPQAKIMGNEKAFLTSENKGQELIKKKDHYILKDEWEISSEYGNILMTLRTEIVDIEKFQQANFNTTDIHSNQGEAFFL